MSEQDVVMKSLEISVHPYLYPLGTYSETKIVKDGEREDFPPKLKQLFFNMRIPHGDFDVSVYYTSLPYRDREDRERYKIITKFSLRDQNGYVELPELEKALEKLGYTPVEIHYKTLHGIETERAYMKDIPVDGDLYQTIQDTVIELLRALENSLGISLVFNRKETTSYSVVILNTVKGEELYNKLREWIRTYLVRDEMYDRI